MLQWAVTFCQMFFCMEVLVIHIRENILCDKQRTENRLNGYIVCSKYLAKYVLIINVTQYKCKHR